MAWLNYREVQHRFGHIDAEFVRSDVSVSAQASNASVTVRFYPWWEHPKYLKAREAGGPWGFTDAVEAGRRNVTVKAVGPYAARVSQRVEVIDWVFSEEHPLLWPFAEQVTLYVNGAFDVLDLTRRLLALDMPFVTRTDLHGYFDPNWERVSSRGISVPAQLCASTVRCLTDMNVTMLPCKAPTIPRMTVFLIGDTDYIVAEDFLVDVPEFTHDPEWFDPTPRPNRP